MTDPKRATGRTLGLALQALGKAVENPGTEVEFINHNPQNHAQHQMYKKQIELLAETLHLDVSVAVSYNAFGKWAVFVESNWVSPYSQRTPAEEKWKEIYGFYPKTDVDQYWECFLKGFEAAQND